MKLKAISIAAAAFASTAFGAAHAATQDNYPNKPVRLVVPFTPGGSTDILARLVAKQITDSFGQQCIIDNRPGAGGTIGMEIAARAAPDGYTLVMGHIGTLAVNPALYTKLSYDPVKDFQPITLVAMIPNMMTVNPKIPVKTVKEVIALAQTKPGALNYGSGGNGSAAHLATEYFKLLTKTDITHVPYRGTAPAVTDLIAGNISLMITGVPPQLGQIKAGRLRPIAVATPKRIAMFPDIPTIGETVKGYEATQWYGILAPAAVPKAYITKLNGAIVKALHSPEAKERLATEAAEPVGNSPEEFGRFIKSEIARWAPVVKQSGAKPD
ncbi:MAG: tripartite tricarboxylate transporter substrate binding protein [Betaproteobacteria bacterium]|nr:tripartite tricarboxylate transporter substrate binding protein [Betaproteobacteria bacterium]